jgi:hypothetical protein
MRGRIQAIGAVTSLAILSLIVSPLVILTTAGVALVTLVQGYREGLLNLVAATVILTVFTGLALGQAAIGLELAIKFLLPAWILGSIVLLKSSISFAIMVAGTASGLLVIALYTFTDPAAHWLELINKQLLPMLKEAGMQIQEGPKAEELWLFMSKIMTGSALAVFLAVQTMSLLLARWWQAMLYNPKGFTQEFHQLRFGGVVATTALAIVVLAVTTKNEIALNLFLVVISFMLFQGLAVIHHLVAKCKLGSAWLVGVYIIMLFTLQSGAIGVLVVAAVGLSDNWVNFRHRLCTNKVQDDMS